MILLFGSTGFLGGHLHKELPFEVLPVNIRVQSSLEKIHEKATVFVNCVGKAHVQDSPAQEEEFNYVNYELVKVVFDLFLKSEAELFIHFSSIAAVEEIGREEVLTEESYTNPISNYGKSKAMAEKFLLEQKLPDSKKIVILRPVMIYGEGDKGNLRFLYKLISKGIPYPFAKFSNRRSMIDVRNVAFLVSEIITNKEKLIKDKMVFNIADDVAIPTRRIIDLIGTVLERKVYILNIPQSLILLIGKLGDLLKLPINSQKIQKLISALIVSNSKIKETLNIERLPIEGAIGLQNTLNTFKNSK